MNTPTPDFETLASRLGLRYTGLENWHTRKLHHFICVDADSPYVSLSFYAPEDATCADVETRWREKRAEYDGCACK